MIKLSKLAEAILRSTYANTKQPNVRIDFASVLPELMGKQRGGYARALQRLGLVECFHDGGHRFSIMLTTAGFNLAR